MIDDLKELKKINGDGFLFSTDGGAKSVCRRTLYLNLHYALVNIGISKEQIAERKLHLHGWRHFFNTELLKGGLTIPQAQAVTGHKSKRMTEWYCHFDATEFAKASAVQEALLQPAVEKPKEGAEKAAAKPEVRNMVLPFPANKAKRKNEQQAQIQA